MFDRLMIGYIVFYLVVVTVSATIGAVGCLLLTDRRRDRRQLEADITAADAAPVPARVLASRLDDPYPQPALEAPPDAGTELADTGELHWIRQQLDLDDFALAMEQQFYDLLERTRADFQSIRLPA